MAEIQYNVEVQVDDRPVQGLERSLSDAADVMHELARLTATLNGEMARSRQGTAAYAELEERQKAINQEMDRQTEVVNRNADSLERTGESGSLSIGKIASILFTTGIGLQLAGRGISDLERRFVRFARATGGTVGQQFQDYGRSLSGMLFRLNSVIGVTSLATAGALALGAAVAGGTVTVVAASAAMNAAVGKVKAYASELNTLEQAAIGANESMQDIAETVRAGQRLGLNIRSGDFRQFAEARDRALQDADGAEAQAYVRLGLAPGSGLGEVRDALLQVEDDALRTSLAIDLFGRSLGARISMIDEVSEAERNATALRLANADKVKAAASVWNELNQRVEDGSRAITANISGSVERFGETLLPILDDILLWLTYSPQIETLFGHVENILTALAEAARWLLGVSPQQQAAWRAQAQREALGQRIAADIASRRTRQDRLALDASNEQQKAASASAQSSEAFQAAVNATDDTLRSILPQIECGAESAAAVTQAQAQAPVAGDPGFIGPLQADPVLLQQWQAQRYVEQQAQGRADAAANEKLRLGSRFGTLGRALNPYADTPSWGEIGRAFSGGPDRANIVDATIQAIPGPSAAQAYGSTTRWLDDNVRDSVANAVRDVLTFDFPGFGGRDRGGAGDAFDAGDTIYDIDLTYNDRRGGGSRPDVRGMADDVVRALDHRYTGD